MQLLKYSTLLLISFVFSTNVFSQYCYPTFTTSCSNNYLDSVYIGGNLSAINNYYTGCTGTIPTNSTTYNDTICLLRGMTYPLSINLSLPYQNVNVLIDYNHDLDFSDPGESIHHAINYNQLNSTGVFTVPTTAMSGITRLRVIITSDTLNSNPCGAYTSGEVEDYYVNITPITGPNSSLSCGCITASNTNFVACDSVISPSNNAIWTTSGYYTDTLINNNLCDSIIFANVTITNSSSDSIYFWGCDSVISPSTNQVWTSSGFYTDTVLNSQLCDSIIYATVTITSINDSIFQSNDTLFAIENGASYQWAYCTTQLILPNDTLQSFAPTASGNYICQVTKNGCSKFTNCITYTATGVAEIINEKSIQLIPNPAKEYVDFIFSKRIKAKIYITTVSGKTVFKTKVNNSKISIDISKFAKGIYFVKIENDSYSIVKKLIKQ